MLDPNLTPHASTSSFSSFSSSSSLFQQSIKTQTNNKTHNGDDQNLERKKVYKNGLIKRVFLFVCLLLTGLVNGCKAESGLKNRVKAPDELFQSCSPELMHTHSFRHFANMCKTKTSIAIVAYNGVQDSMEECRERMRFQSWDCSQPGTILHEPSLLRYGYRETAYLLAMSAAGAAWGIATACNYGWLDDCKCTKPESTFLDEKFELDGKFDPGIYENSILMDSANDDWNWQGCSYGINFGISTSRKLFTRTGQLRNPLRKMERHNLKAGRLAVKKTQISTCKCHGVSGSCELRTCWKKTADLREIADHLTDRYYKAKQINSETTKVKNGDLIYYEPSPEICSPYTYEIKQRRSLPRICHWRNETHSMGNCEMLCCGRESKTLHEPTIKPCDCQVDRFFRVVCKECVQHQWITRCT